MKKFIVAIAAVAAISLASCCGNIDNKKTVEENLEGVDTCAVVADTTVVVDGDTLQVEGVVEETCEEL